MLRLRERRETSTRSQELQESQTKRDSRQRKIIIVLIMARRPFRREARKQNAKTTKVIKGPKATASEIKSRTSKETQSQSPLARTPPPQPPPRSPPPPPPRTPPALGMPHASNADERQGRQETHPAKSQKTDETGRNLGMP